MKFFQKPQHLFNYFIFHQNLDNSIISNLLDSVSNIDFESGTVDYGNENLEMRSSQLKWILSNPSTDYIFSLLSEKIKIANDSYFNFQIPFSPEAIQYTEYHSFQKGHYNWHQDIIMDQEGSMSPTFRKLSLTIQLSDPEEYEGGDLQIFDPIVSDENFPYKSVPKKKGSIIVFPSFSG